MNKTDYQKVANEARKKVLELIYKAQTSHIGSNFSCIDILTVLFDKIDLDKDKFVLSAGWKAASLYYFLWKKGRITEEELNSYCQPGSKFIGLSEPIHKDVPFAGGSMGLGLPAAVGFALAKKLKGEKGKVYCLMSDGEMQCGTTMESAKIATKNHLNNLIVIEDKNGWQAMGRTDEILKNNEIYEFVSYGWNVVEVDGHNYQEIEDFILRNLCETKAAKTLLTPRNCWPNQDWIEGKKYPTLVIAHTIKGKGVSFMEDKNIFHYKQLNEEEYNQALKELNGKNNPTTR